MELEFLIQILSTEFLKRTIKVIDPIEFRQQTINKKIKLINVKGPRNIQFIKT